MKYRPEIDGLRALAVLPVIFFHAGFEWFSGGFVGVDVFFVISGYLITTIIISEMIENKFSVARFYDRRARRILPALLLVLLSCLPFSLILLTPNDLIDFSQSLIAVSSFSSNIFFWLESGYFDTAAELKPLLHTWSLAVEEQFYILFPIFLGLAWRLGISKVLAVLAMIFLISLGVAHWGAFNKPSPTFFLLPTRGWELIMGVFIAFYLKFKNHLASHLLNQILSLLGFGMILYSIVRFDEHTPFPSLYALVPTVGTLLLIYTAVPKTFVYKLLSLAPLVKIGLISFSAYLWHQPLIAFSRHWATDDGSNTLLLFLCAASIILAWLSWKYVEKPFRDKNRITNNTFYTVVVGSTLFILLFAVVNIQQHGFPNRFSSEINALEQSKKPNLIIRKCHHRMGEAEPKNCILGDKNKTPVYALLGDSHANSIAEALSDAAIEKGFSFLYFAKDGCMPSYEIEGSSGAHKNCPKFNLNVINQLQQRNIQNVIIFNRFNWYFEKEGFKNEYHFQEDKNVFHYTTNTNIDSDNQSLQKISNIKSYVLDILSSGIRIYYVLPIPETGWNVSKRKIKSIRSKSNLLPPFQKKYYENSTLNKFNTFSSEFKDKLFSIVDTQKIFCDKEFCYSENDDFLLYSDDDHPSHQASKLIVDEILKIIEY